jgi:hypothetical protein
MPYPSRTLVLFPSATVSANTTSPKLIIIENYTSFIARASVGTATGTSPTLDIYIQQGMRPDVGTEVAGTDAQGTDANIIWDDYAHFAQITASSQVKYLRVVGGGNVSSAASDAALSAGTIQNGPIGSLWRIKLVVGGTSPSFATTKVLVQFIP